METPSSPSGGIITRPTSRRTLVKGVAWSVPAVSIAAATPAFAASPAPLVNGLFNTGGICSEEIAGSPTAQISLNTVGAERGLWVFHAPPGQIAGATITLFVPEVVNGTPVPDDLTFNVSTVNDAGGWSAMVPDSNPPGGALADHHAWTMTYTGSWSEVSGSPDVDAFPTVSYHSQADSRVIITSDTFSNTQGSFCGPPNPSITVRRRAVVRGVTLQQERTGDMG